MAMEPYLIRFFTIIFLKINKQIHPEPYHNQIRGHDDKSRYDQIHTG